MGCGPQKVALSQQGTEGAQAGGSQALWAHPVWAEPRVPVPVSVRGPAVGVEGEGVGSHGVQRADRVEWLLQGHRPPDDGATGGP